MSFRALILALEKKILYLKNNKQPRWTNRLHSGCIILETKTGTQV